jgi:hypothetical protein
LEEVLVEYIKKEREKGFLDKAIRKALEDSGYSKDRLDMAFKELATTKTTDLNSKDISAKPDQKKGILAFYEKQHRAINFGFLCIAAVTIGILFFFLLGMIWTGEQTHDLPVQNPGAQYFGVVQDVYYYNDSNYNDIPLIGAGCGYEEIRISRLCRAVFKSDESICEGNDYDIVSCKDYVKMTKAMTTENKKACSEMSNDKLRQICNAAVDKDNSLCKTVTEKEMCNEAFALFSAIRTNDKSLCNSPLVEDKDREFCKTMISESGQVGKSIEPCRRFYDIRCP